jgi:hypothetical protein
MRGLVESSENRPVILHWPGFALPRRFVASKVFPANKIRIALGCEFIEVRVKNVAHCVLTFTQPKEPKKSRKSHKQIMAKALEGADRFFFRRVFLRI